MSTSHHRIFRFICSILLSTLKPSISAPSLLSDTNSTAPNISTTSYITTTFQSFDQYITAPFNDNEITCLPNTNCYVECIGTQICQDKTLNAINAHNLYLTCFGVESCEDMIINGPNNNYKNTNIIIHCNYSDSSHTPTYESGACDDIKFYGGDNVNSIEILCDGYYDCHSADFHLGSAQTVNIIFNGLSYVPDVIRPSQQPGGAADIHAENVTNHINVTCIGYDSCDRSYMYCPYGEDTKCRTSCYGEGSCSWTRYTILNSDYNGLELNCILSSESVSSENCFRYETGERWAQESSIACKEEGLETDVVYNKYKNEEVSCSSSVCCPFVFQQIDCTEDECIIDCTTQSCDGHIINSYNEDTGFKPISLEIICKPNDINSTCNGLTIFCPDGECILYCGIKFGCQNVIIREGINSEINLYCDERFGCEDILMYAENALSITINATHFCMLYVVYDFIVYCVFRTLYIYFCGCYSWIVSK